MTHGSSEILQLIAEQAASTDERLELEQVARALGRLDRRVPYRSEFRTQLRDQLRHEARRRRPWYRRPMVWTVGGAVAASVATMAVLNLWQEPAVPENLPPSAVVDVPEPPRPDPPTAQPAETTGPPANGQFRPSTQLVQDLKVPRIALQDEWEGAAPRSSAVASATTVTVPAHLVAPLAPATLQVYAVTQLPPRTDALADRAKRLGFRSEVSGAVGQTLLVEEADRSLALQPDGKLIYQGPAEGLALPAPDSAGAERAALFWMQDAGLTVPRGERLVVKEMDLWRVSIDPTVPSGQRTITEGISIWVTEKGHIVRAEAMTGALEELGEVASVSFDEAVDQMRTMRLQGVEGQADLTVEGAELVYARVSTGRPGSSVYLQPYWRLRVSLDHATLYRYVPAIGSGHLQ